MRKIRQWALTILYFAILGAFAVVLAALLFEDRNVIFWSMALAVGLSILAFFLETLSDAN